MEVEGNRRNRPSTVQQKALICQIVRDIPSVKEMLEYTDFFIKERYKETDLDRYISITLKLFIA